MQEQLHMGAEGNVRQSHLGQRPHNLMRPCGNRTPGRAKRQSKRSRHPQRGGQAVLVAETVKRRTKHRTRTWRAHEQTARL